MTITAARPVAEHERTLLDLIARPLDEVFRAACWAEADAHYGWVDPNRVRERVMAEQGDDFDPRAYSGQWSRAAGPNGYLDKTDVRVPIDPSGSKRNGAKDVLMRRWRGWVGAA